MTTNKNLDIKRRIVEYIAERLRMPTLSVLDSYEAAVLAILHYTSIAVEEGTVDPEKLIDLYLDYKLSVDARARRDLIELFKHAVEAPPPAPVAPPSPPQTEEEKKKRFKLI